MWIYCGWPVGFLYEKYILTFFFEDLQYKRGKDKIVLSEGGFTSLASIVRS